MEELKPCPFCGSSVMYLCTKYDRIGIEMNTVFCNSCKTSFSNEDVEDDELGTREWWNEKLCTTSAARTCRDASTDCDIWQCSECGIQFDNPSYFPTLWDGSKVSAPRFCPGCGARVVE